MATAKGEQLYTRDSALYPILHEPLPPPPLRAKKLGTRDAKELWGKAIGGVRNQLKDVVINQFHYSPIHSDEIRILGILGGTDSGVRCVIYKRRLADVRNGYEALSYTWGGPKELPTHSVLIRNLDPLQPQTAAPGSPMNPKPKAAEQWSESVRNLSGVRFPVRRNLYEALLHLRHETRTVHVWVDAICIDQSPAGQREKEQQLARMADIYNSASNVFVWLGDAREGSGDGIALVREMVNLRSFDQLVAGSAAASRWANLIRIMNAPWFTRRWIIQEVALAKSATVHCGTQAVHWDDFADAVGLLYEKIDELKIRYRDVAFEDLENSSAMLLIQTIANVCRKTHTGQVQEKLLDLESLVSTLLKFQARDPRDTIYSVLSLAKDKPHPDDGPLFDVSANYKESTRDLFMAFVHRCIRRSKSLDIICRHWAPPVTDVFRRPVTMPSWVSPLSQSPYGLYVWGEARGRQHGENFVDLRWKDRRKRYNACGPYEAAVQALGGSNDSYVGGDADEVVNPTNLVPPTLQITGTPILQSPLQSPLSERPNPFARQRMPSISEESRNTANSASKEGQGTNGPSSLPQNGVGSRPRTPQQAPAGPDRPSSAQDWAAVPGLRVTTLASDRLSASDSNLFPQGAGPASTDAIPGVSGRRSSEASLRDKEPSPSKRPSIIDDSETRHRLGDTLIAEGFVLGRVAERSDVMRGGIVPSDWLPRTGWDENNHQNRVPDKLWRTLVADRGPDGANPPAWYQRACLYCLTNPTITDVAGNVAVAPALTAGDYPEMALRFLRRVCAVVWKRRLFEAVPDGPWRPAATVPVVAAELNGAAAAPLELAKPPLFGLAPEGTKDNDLVCLLFGCTVPVVLRRLVRTRSSGQERFRIVGEAYMHGLMDGEAVQNEDLVRAARRQFRLV